MLIFSFLCPHKEWCISNETTFILINYLQVGIYLLEAGLAKLDFLSDANSRMKKFNQLMKKVMEKLHNYIIPGNVYSKLKNCYYLGVVSFFL